MKFRLLILTLMFSVCLLHADFASETLAEINVIRQKAGEGSLSADPNLMSIAQEWAEHIASIKSLKHRSGEDLLGILRRYSWQELNENLYYSPSPVTPDMAVQSWMKSPPHHKNLMKASITSGGIGIKDGADGMVYVVFNGAS